MSRSDGESPLDFEQGGDATYSRFERVRSFFDQYVYAPGKVGWEDWRTRYGTLILLGYFLMGTVGVVVIDRPEFNETEPFIKPLTNLQYPLGTGLFGQSLLEQIVHATPAMFKMMFAGAGISILLAVVLGVTAGYKGGFVDTVLMGITDVVLTIPGLPLILIIAALVELRDPFLVGLVLGIDNWPGLSRALRSQVLSIRQESYIEASRAMGIPTRRVIVKEVAPQLMPYILINAAGAARGVIYESVGLYFLGILPFTTLNWGVILNMAYSQGGALSDFARIHYLYVPAIAISGIAFGLILFSQGMDRVFNPRLRARHEKSAPDEEQLERT